MLDAALKAQLKGHLTHLRRDIRLQATLDTGDASARLRALLEDIASLSPRVQLSLDGTDARRPSFAVIPLDERGAPLASAGRLRFAGLPLGHEFTSLVLALLWAGGHPPKVEPAVIEQVRALTGSMRLEVYMSLSCHNCPEVVQAAALLALHQPGVEAVVIDGALFQDEVAARQVMAVPMVFLNGQNLAAGRMTVEELLAKVDAGAESREAQRLSAEEPFDVLVVGGGPAGASAAVYAARKGLRVGLVAQRFGGQVNDTLAIENYASVLHTEGPAFAAALEAQVRQYGVRLMTGQVAEGLRPAGADTPWHKLDLANGATLRARSVVLSPGARWRELGVPGEADYRNRGVAYCPHCDGPLFKGKRVAVVGGGNSGVEAAIDLAGIAEHVTLIEYGDALKADAVLVQQLQRLPNTDVVLQAETTEVVGDGARVTALRWRDRRDDSRHERAVDGVFVQIGLVPGTDWLQGAVALTPRGEIAVDARGQTDVPGVLAAGDATTSPYKQIGIAAGDGAKAALAAFDYLVRHGAIGSTGLPVTAGGPAAPAAANAERLVAGDEARAA